MPLIPVARRSVPDDVFDQLVGSIVRGDLAAGESLPGERQLAEVLQVSRPAVREALQRLSQAGLVETRHGGGTTVRDYRDTAGLDLLPELLIRDGVIDLDVARGIVELRANAGPHLASLAAARASEADHAILVDLVEAHAAAVASDDDLQMQAAALDLWDAIVVAADNLVYRLLWNRLRATYDDVRGALAVLMHEEVSDADGHRAIVEAIRAGDPKAAEGAATSVLARGTTAATQVLEALRSQRKATR